jgi:hypothetical protein
MGAIIHSSLRRSCPMQQGARGNILVISVNYERTQPHLKMASMVCINRDVKLFDGASLQVGDDILRRWR